MEFDCKLAHEDHIKRISNFKSIKELYDQLANTFSLAVDEILYCTLNTHNFRNVNAVLGNYLSFGDLIVVHICGTSKDLHLNKTHEFLGLTITDNGQGRAFVKKVISDQRLVETNVRPGDHIAAINNVSTIGLRHFEVAKAIREIPRGIDFTMRLIEPKYSDHYLQNDDFTESNDKENGTIIDRMRINPASNDSSVSKNPRPLNGLDNDILTCEELIHSSLPIGRLLCKRLDEKSEEFELDGTSYVRKAKFDPQSHYQNAQVGMQDGYRITIAKINSILESFLGINDNLLAIRIYRLARENKDSYSQFLGAIQTSELSAFDFNDDMKSYLWDCASNNSAMVQ